MADITDIHFGELEILSSKDLRLLPLTIIISEIHDLIVSYAASAKLFCDFSIGSLLENIDKKIATPDNRNYILEELHKLFPDVKFTEICVNSPNYVNNPKYVNNPHYKLYRANWGECIEEIINNTNVENVIIELDDDVDDDFYLEEAIKESLKEQYKITREIIGKKAEERLLISQKKYKKLYK